MKWPHVGPSSETRNSPWNSARCAAWVWMVTALPAVGSATGWLDARPLLAQEGVHRRQPMTGTVGAAAGVSPAVTATVIGPSGATTMGTAPSTRGPSGQDGAVRLVQMPPSPGGMSGAGPSGTPSPPGYAPAAAVGMGPTGPMPGFAPGPAMVLPPTFEAVPLRARDFSWIHIEAPPPPELVKVHDIITIEVDEKAEVVVNSRFNRQRNGAYKVELKDFVTFGQGPSLKNVASTGPAVEGNLQNRLQTIGQSTDSEGITYRIAATVVDVLPNGTLILEARKTIRTNQDFFEYRLTGSISSRKVKADRTARTEDIADLQIERSQRGKVFDSTKTFWGTRVLDAITPF